MVDATQIMGGGGRDDNVPFNLHTWLMLRKSWVVVRDDNEG